jgi:glutamyl-tRNA synthetase
MIRGVHEDRARGAEGRSVTAQGPERPPGDRSGRYAPSPTGDLHLGNLRTALLSWLFARSAGGRHLLRIDDLDPERSAERWERRQLADLEALGIDWDGPPLRQSGRGAEYAAAIEELERAGLLYPCWCSRREIREATSAPHGPLPEGAYPGTCRQLDATERRRRERSGRPAALRVRAEEAVVGFDDRLRGECSGQVDDFVVRRKDGAPAYNLATTIDDAAQGIDEVVRGRDLLGSTPRQLWLAERLGVPAPASWAHVPLLLGPDGRRLAKRHGAVSLEQRRRRGESSAQVRGALAASLGLCEPGEQPSPARLLERFDPAKLPTADAEIAPGD